MNMPQIQKIQKVVESIENLKDMPHRLRIEKVLIGLGASEGEE
jgi:tetrahydromethanopterin S-methyltransferase subunit F